MDSQDLSPASHVHSSRPSIGFPLGTALLLIVIFTLSGFFSCCYHWDKIRSLRRSFSTHTDPEADSIPSSSSKATSLSPDSKQSQNYSMPVIMPGDKIPKFIALPCPCEPPRPEKIAVEVQKPPLMQTIVYNHVARFGVYYDG